jgi:hypothetical protein
VGDAVGLAPRGREPVRLHDARHLRPHQRLDGPGAERGEVEAGHQCARRALDDGRLDRRLRRQRRDDPEVALGVADERAAPRRDRRDRREQGADEHERDRQAGAQRRAGAVALRRLGGVAHDVHRTAGGVDPPALKEAHFPVLRQASSVRSPSACP